MLRDGGAPALLMLVRIVSMCCVPLFMLLSGYLLCHKTCSAAYYRKAGKTVFIYIAASLFCVYGYPFLYTHLAGLLGLPCQAFAPVRFFRDGVLKILDFSAAPYDPANPDTVISKEAQAEAAPFTLFIPYTLRRLH